MEFLRSDREQLMNATVDISDGKNSKQAIHSSGIEQLPSVGRAFMDNLLRSNLLSASMADRFLESNARRLPECDSAAALGEFLIEAGLLTQYQFDRIMAGTAYGLVLGQYRVLERLGAGGM